jgi:hypothetical protein
MLFKITHRFTLLYGKTTHFNSYMNLNLFIKHLLIKYHISFIIRDLVDEMI